MKTKIPTIQTTSLTMRPFSKKDAWPLHKILSDREVLQFFPNPDPPTIEAVRKLIEAQLRHWDEHGYGWWAIEPLSTPRLIGWGGLRWLHDTEETEVAYLLARDNWGSGFATEIARSSLDFAFNKPGIENVVGIVHPDNIASSRVLEKSDMSYTGRYHYFGMECDRFIKYISGLSDIER